MNYFDVLFAKKQSGGGGTPTLITKTITENGTYNASEDNADGYSQVTVAVEGFKKKSIANTPTDIASFDDGTANPMPSLEISIVPVQSGSGDPSPSNVRPISGWSGAKIADDAKYGGFINWNQLVNFQNSTREAQGVTLTCANGLLSISGSPASAGYFGYSVKIISGHKYCGYISESIANVSISEQTSTLTFGSYFPFGNSKSGIAEAVNSNNNASVGIFFNTSYDGAAHNFYYGIFDLTQIFGATIADYIYQLEQTTAGAGVAYFRNLFPKDYYPYNAGEITTVSAVNGDVDKYSITSIPFHDSSDNPITVYGGRLDVTSGELVVDEIGVVYNGSESGWTWTDMYKQASISLPSNAKYGVARVNYKCNRLTPIANESRPSNIGNFASLISNGAGSAFSAPNCNTLSEFTSWLANNNVQFVYELATSQTYQLTPAQVTTLLEQNNIFADCGQILEGEYFVTL